MSNQVAEPEKPTSGTGGSNRTARGPWSEPRAIRIVIAAEHSIFRGGLRKLLEGEPDLQVVGEAGTPAEAVATTLDWKPDLLLLDVAMGRASGIDLLEGLRDLAAQRIILLAEDIERADVLRALQLGARGIVLKSIATEMLFKAIRSVMKGEYWIGRDMVEELVQMLAQVPKTRTDPPASQTFVLTDRERDIVRAIIAGHTNREIARTFALSEDTVKHHLTNIFDKTGATTRLELALFALHHRLVEQATSSVMTTSQHSRARLHPKRRRRVVAL